jgi:DNA-binding FadR family transcriptional regulator
MQEIRNKIWIKISIKAGDLDELREVFELHSLRAAAIRPKLLAQRAVSFNRTKTFQVAHNRLKRIEQEFRFHTRIGRASAKGVLPLAKDRLLNSPLAIAVDVEGRPVAS